MGNNRTATLPRLLGALAGALEDHWLFALNSLNGIIFLGSFASPIFMALGFTGPGAAAFGPYRSLCLQRPEHSFFIFGYQMAMEHRMVAIYGALFAAGLVYALLRGAWPPMPIWAYGLLILPMGVDVMTQTIGLRDSTWHWRVLTGGVFGVATVAFLYPRLARMLSIGKGGDGAVTTGVPASSSRTLRG